MSSPPRLRLVLSSLALTLLLGCRHAPTPLATVVLPPPPQATGVWDWVLRANDDFGNQRIETEEWHLVQRGGGVEGYYDRAVTTLSGDGRPFQCNQQLGFTRHTRVRLKGALTGPRITLQELAFDARPGPCDDGARNLVRYRGELRDGALTIEWAPGSRQTLQRRPDEAPKELPAPPLSGPAAASAGAPLDGTFVWELKSIDADGDLRSEREEWHLSEREARVVGYYDRVVERVREGKVFSCNGDPRYETRTRYNVSGNRIGERLTLVETDYVAKPTRCDNGQRRLDRYSGVLSGDGDELVLSWGPGNQLLKRRR